MICNFVLLALVGVVLAINKPQAQYSVDLRDGDMASILARDFSNRDTLTGNVKSQADQQPYQADVSGELPSSWLSQGDSRAYKVADTDSRASASDSIYVDKTGNGDAKTYDAVGEDGAMAQLEVNPQADGSKQYNIHTNKNEDIVGSIGNRFGSDNARANVNNDKDYVGTYRSQQKAEARLVGGNSEHITLNDPNRMVLSNGGVVQRNNSGGGYNNGYNVDNAEIASGVYNGGADGGLIKYRSQANNNTKCSKITNVARSENIGEVCLVSAKESECDEVTYDNKFGEARDEFDITDTKIEVMPKSNSSGSLEYTWPACFQVSMNIKLPAGVSARELGAQVDVEIPERQKMVCYNDYKCGEYTCFYKDLCNTQKNDQLGKTVPVNSVLSNSGNNACTSQTGRIIPFVATVCPATDTKENNRDAFRQELFDNLFGEIHDDIVATIKVYTVPTAFDCNADGGFDFFARFFPNRAKPKPELVGCKKGAASYRVIYFGVLALSGREVECVAKNSADPKCWNNAKKNRTNVTSGNLRTNPPAVVTTPLQTPAPTAPPCKIPPWCSPAFARFFPQCRC